MRLRLTIAILLSAILTFSYGQDNLILFENFTLDDGLPTAGTIQIIQDTTGFLWLASELGLSKFDGENFQIYSHSPSDKYSIPSDIIRRLYISSRGEFWIGTWNGLCKYNPIFDHFDRYIPNPLLPTGDPLNIVTAIDEASDGTIYFLTEGGYLYSIENEVINNSLYLQQGASKQMVIDENDQCWIGSRDKIFRFNIHSNLTTQFDINYPDDVKDPEMTDILVLDSTLLISSYSCDLIEYNFNTKKQRFYDLVDDLSHTTSLLKIGENLYVGTSDGLKIMNLNTGQVNTYTEDQLNSKSLSSSSILDVFMDRQENLWIGTVKGLNVAYRNKGFYSYSYYNIINDKEHDVKAILKDEKSRLWLGYSQGFEVFDEKHVPLTPFFDTKDILPSSQIGEVFCFYQDRNKNIWIGTYMNGLLKYDPNLNQLMQYYPGKAKYSLSGTDVRNIREDSFGNLWIVIHGKGVYVLKKGETELKNITEFDPDIPKIMDQTWAFEISFDRNENLWIASSLGAFYYDFSTGNYQHFNQSSASNHFLSSNFINTVFIDSKDNIWLGSRNGINIISADHSELKIINMKNGLPNNEIQAVNEDDKGNIWISTNNGISRLEPLSGLDFMITNYDMNHGLNTNDFSQHASHFSYDQIMYFGGVFGFTYFDPDQIRIDSIPPKIVLKNFYVFDSKAEVEINKAREDKNTFYLDEHICFTDELRIKEKFGMIGIEFVALNFLNADKNQYRYMLEGLDDEWRSVGSRNIVYFNNLRPGRYTFKVQGSNSFGVWNPEPAKLNFKVIPPIWKSNLALLVYFIMIVVISLYLMNLSVEKAKMKLEVTQEKKLQELRTRFFMNISHELKTPLTLVSVPLKRIKKQYQESGMFPSMEDVNMISRNVDRLIRIMNQIFDFRKIELDKLDIRVSKSGIVGFTKGMLEFFDYQIKQKYIHISTDFPDEEIEFYFDRDKMDKIIFNLLSNAIKNCPDHGEITLEIRKSVISNRKTDSTPILQWIIKDNGPGIPEEKISNLFDRFSYTDSSVNSQGGTGIGLSIVQEFIKLHHGSVSIKSKARKDGYEKSWTMVSLEFPLRDELYTDDQKTVDESENTLTTREYKPEFLSDSVSLTGNYHSDENFSLSENAYTALVIDDDKDICRLLKTELSVNYRVYTACNGLEGIQMAEKYMPDIIISDIMMPEIDGYELCKTLKTKVETSHIPIILLTGKSADEDEIKGYSTGADAFISKPFDLEKLLNRIDTLITSRLQLKRAFLSSYGIELKKVVPSNTDEKFIQKFLKIINDNISDHSLNVDKITREIGMSRSMLYKKLNSITNTSVNIFIRKIRLQRATELLTNGDMSITEVAYAVGFDSLPYFSKCFQEEFGVSPSKYNSEIST